MAKINPVIIVDDSPVIRRTVEHLLRKEGFLVEGAKDSAEFKAILERVQPGLVLFDLILGEEDGFELADWFRNEPRFAEIPYVFLTQSHDLKNVTKGFTYGAVDYITKPIRTPELIARVKNHYQLFQTLTMLEKATKIAEDANRAKTEFVSRMSHEIRTPLSGVTGMLALLQKTELNPQQSDYTRNAQLSINALRTIIDEILDFSKIEAGRWDLELGPIELKDIVDPLIPIYSVQCANSGLQFTLHVSPQIPGKWILDGQKIRQLITNLLNNAVKFTQSGSIILLIDQNPQSKALRITVKDTGKGIPENDIPTLFEAFTQSKSNQLQNEKGTGLGLNICRKIVEMHEGRIEIQSTVGLGTTFIIQIPAQSVDNDAERQFNDLNGKRSSSADNFLNDSHRLPGAPSVLVVDDSDINLEITSTYLRLMGAQVTTASDGAKAWTAFIEGEFDLIFTDFHMDGLSGDELASKVRRSSDIPIIGITAAVTAEDKKTCLNAGMNDVLIKPYEEAQLYALCLKYLPSAQKTATPSRPQNHLQSRLLEIFKEEIPPLWIGLFNENNPNPSFSHRSTAHRLAGSFAQLGCSPWADQFRLIENCPEDEDMLQLIRAETGRINHCSDCEKSQECFLKETLQTSITNEYMSC